MKIAVIGGNLLGCATTLNLALVQELDHRRLQNDHQPPEHFDITLFEATSRLGGNALRSLTIDDHLRVEVGTYRTLPLLQGSYLYDLYAAANDHRATFGLLNKRYPMPGAMETRRGKNGSAKALTPWDRGSHRHLIRTFAAWDWQQDTYHIIHSGWSALDIIYRILDNQLWRSLALAALIYSINILRVTHGHIPRAMALAQCLVMFALFVLSPKRVIAMWQHHYSFWGTTILMLFKHGISPAISRGSSLGLAKHFADMNTKNIATCSVSVANLVNRAALEPYLRSTANDYVRKFKYDPTFVDRYIAPVVAWHYQGAQLGEVNSLASGFTLLDSDFANADANVRLSTISPDNATLCTALIQAASATLNVDVKLTTTVTRVEYKEAESKYVLTYGNAQTAEFDGVVLCASPKEGDMIIDTSVGNSLSELLGYDRDTQAAGGHMEDEARNVADRAEEHIAGDKEPAVAAATCSHFAVVVGKANASFFRFSEESHIPDLVQITHAPGCSRFERIREYCDNMPGVYTVLCGPDFESSGLFSEMFEDESELRYHEAMSESRYTHSAVPEGKEIDDCMPYIVLGNRFVYAAATRRLAKHPEVDAMSAVNTASLFSRAVEWASSEKEDGWCRKQLIPHAFIEVAIQAPLPEGMSHRSEWML